MRGFVIRLFSSLCLVWRGGLVGGRVTFIVRFVEM